MTVYLKESTNVTAALGPFIDDTDQKSAETGYTATLSSWLSASKVGGVFAARSSTGTVTQLSGGWYGVPLCATDVNTVGSYILFAHNAGHLPVWKEFTVLSANTYDSLIGGTDLLQSDVREIKGGLKIELSGANTVGVSSVTDIDFSATMKTSLETGIDNELNEAYTDATSLTANGIRDRLRTLGWVNRNKMEVTDATGVAQLYKDNNTTTAISGTVTDDATTTTRTRLA